MTMHMMGSRIGLLGLALIILLFILFIKLIIGISLMHGQRETEDSEVKLKKRMKNYKEAGLSESEIKLFRDTMAEAKRQIKVWSKATREKSDLSVIEDVTGGLASAKKTFQFIVENPQELTKQNDFLYRDLPNMEKLIDSYNKLQAVSVKNESDISETLLLIRTLSSKVEAKYREILMKDVKIIEKEIQNG